MRALSRAEGDLTTCEMGKIRSVDGGIDEPKIQRSDLTCRRKSLPGESVTGAANGVESDIKLSRRKRVGTAVVAEERKATIPDVRKAGPQ